MDKSFFSVPISFHRNVSNFILLFLCMFGLISCSSDSDDEDVSQDRTTSMLIGEWANTKTESYDNQDNLVRTSRGWKSDEAAWIFGEDGYFCQAVYDIEGSFTLSGNRIKINGTRAEGSYEIRKLTSDSLVVWHKYHDTEYSYQLSYFERLSFYDEDTNGTVGKDAMKFVGTWYDGGKHYWYFAKNGNLYISKKEHVNTQNYITKQSWSYDASTNTLATTARWEDVWESTNYTWGNFAYSWTVLAFDNNFWTGENLYASKSVTTFTKIE